MKPIKEWIPRSVSELWGFVRTVCRGRGLEVFCFVFGAMLLTSIVAYQNGIRWQGSGSAPKGLVRVVEERALEEGHWVSVCLEGPWAELAMAREYVPRVPKECPSGLQPLLKVVDKIGPGEREALPMALTLDGKDRELVPWPSRKIDAGEVWLRSPYEHPGAFDSRYFGPVPEEWIGRQVVPVLVKP